MFEKSHSKELAASASERLFRNKQKIKVEKTANDALLTTLSAETLRFLKKRRNASSFEKVPLTLYRERQLRAIFKGLDFDKMGTIHLDLVKDAANYAEAKLKPKRGQPVFNNIQKMFEAMDEDGDGTVDFHEFTIAMTGNAKSTMDTASEYDVERLTKRFIEFANIRKRERALNKIESHMDGVGSVVAGRSVTDTSTDSVSNAQLAATHVHEKITKTLVDDDDSVGVVGPSYDADKMDSFRTCFAVFNSRVTDESIEEETRKYYEMKGIKRKPPLSGTAGLGLKNMGAATTMSTTELSRSASVPNFKTQAVKTQDLLDSFLTEVSTFLETPLSPAHRMRVTERRLEETLTAEAVQLAAASTMSDHSKPPEPDDMGSQVIEKLTPWQERIKKETEFLDIQKRRAEERLKKAEADMLDLEVIESAERLHEEQIYLKNIKKKPWMKLPNTCGVPKYSGPIRKPTLVPLSTDKVLGTELRMRVQTRKEIQNMKQQIIKEQQTRAEQGISYHPFADSVAGGSSVGEDSSVLFVGQAKKGVKSIPIINFSK